MDCEEDKGMWFNLKEGSFLAAHPKLRLKPNPSSFSPILSIFYQEKIFTKLLSFPLLIFWVLLQILYLVFGFSESWKAEVGKWARKWPGFCSQKRCYILLLYAVTVIGWDYLFIYIYIKALQRLKEREILILLCDSASVALLAQWWYGDTSGS